MLMPSADRLQCILNGEQFHAQQLASIHKFTRLHTAAEHTYNMAALTVADNFT